MKYMIEIAKIIEGGLKADKEKVIAYAELLASKLEKDGEKKAANRFRKAFAAARSRKLEPNSLKDNGRLPVDSESHLSLAKLETVDEYDTEVYLDRLSQETVSEFLQNVKASDALMSAGLDISPSLIIYGPPGCGKTELARAISAALKLPLLTARTDGLISSYLGSTAKNIRSLFEHAMSHPCVLFLDEFDALAKMRDDRHELGELKRVVISLLQNIDALDRETILLAATNHHHLLDPAVWRRFSYKISLDLPSREIRKKILYKFLRDFSPAEQMDSLAQIADGLSGSDIRQAAEDCIRNAVVSNQKQVKDFELFRRITRLRLSQNGIQNLPINGIVKATRELDPNIFSYRLLSEMYSISKSTVGNYLKA